MLTTAYYFGVLTMVCLVAKIKWLIPFRKNLLLIFPIIGCGLATVGGLEVSLGGSICFGFLMIIFTGIAIWSIFNRNKETVEIIHIPAHSYEVAAIDTMEIPTADMVKFYLMYQEQVYMISSPLPEGKPALERV